MSQFDEAAENARTCAYADARPPRFQGYLCERDAGHYPATPHGAFLGALDHPPVFWNNVGQETDEDSVALEPFKPLLTRSYVEAKQKANDDILRQLAARGAGVAMGDLLTTYVALIVERLFGDMDDQLRLELENAYADEARKRLEATASEVMQELIRRGVTPSGIIHLPNGGQR